MIENPFVSLIIPFRNEEKYIANCIYSLLENDYPQDKYEILLINGLSTDNSPKIIETYIQKKNNIKLIHNPLKIFPVAVNIGIRNAQGEIIIILGAHATYSKNYISKCVYNLITHHAGNSGGILHTLGQDETFIGKLISQVLTNRFGVGNSTFRTGSNTISEVDTVFGGCYHRSTFEKIGFFNENLISTSDLEFNTRLRRYKEKIILDPDIVATYYTRSTPGKFLKNNLRNGFWSIYPIKFVSYIPVSLRHFIPLFFAGFIFICLLLSIVWPIILWPFLVSMVLYFTLALIASIHYIKQNILYFLLAPFLFFTLHFTYGLGSIYALIKVCLFKIFKI